MNKFYECFLNKFLFLLLFLAFSSEVQAISFTSGHGDICYDNYLNYKTCAGSHRDLVKRDSAGNFVYCANRSKHFAGNSATYSLDSVYASDKTCNYYLPVSGGATTNKKYTGDCSSIIGYIIAEGNRNGSDYKEKWFWAQASVWIYLGKFSSRFKGGNTEKYGTVSVSDIWNNNLKIQKIIRNAWKKYDADKKSTVENSVSDEVNFDVFVSNSDNQFHYVPTSSSCGSGSYITNTITIKNNESRRIHIEVPITFDNVSLCLVGTTDCYSKATRYDGSDKSEIFEFDLKANSSVQIQLSTRYVLKSSIKLTVFASYTENVNVRESFRIYDSKRYEKQNYQGVIVQTTKNVNKNGAAVIEHEKTRSLEFSQVAVTHKSCPSSNSNGANSSNSSSTPVSKVCAGYSENTSPLDYTANFSGCNCLSIDLGNGSSVNVLLSESVSFRYGNLVPNLIYAGGGFGFTSGNDGVSTAYSGRLVWNFADYYGPISNNVPYYYNPNGDYKANTDAIKAIIQNKIENMIKKYMTINFSTYDSNDEKNVNRVIVSLPLYLSNISYDSITRTFKYEADNIQMNPAYLSQEGVVSYIKNDNLYPISGGNKYYIPIKFNTIDNLFPFDIVNTNLSVTDKGNFWLRAKCNVKVDEQYILDSVRYRSIDVANPFPKATMQSDLLVYWRDWYTNKSNILRLKNTFTNNYPNRPLYSIVLTEEKIKEINKVSDLYTSWKNININGESSFINDFFEIKDFGNRSYCGLGEFKASCDQYSS